MLYFGGLIVVVLFGLMMQLCCMRVVAPTRPWLALRLAAEWAAC